MIIFREIRLKDKRDIVEIARGTWEGEDYLPYVFDSWISSGNFYGLEKDGKIIATGKISVLPDNVGWLEGLRVHPDYRGKGYGRLMHDHLIKKAYELKDKGIINTIEFSTYFKNQASISMGIKDNFKIVKRYYGVDGLSENIDESQISSIGSINEIDYTEYIPCGWKFIHKTDDAINYIKRNCKVMKYNNLKFLFTYHEPWEVTPFTLDPHKIRILFPAFSYYAIQHSTSFSLKIPAELDHIKYENIGLKKWEDVSEPEILVLKKVL